MVIDFRNININFGSTGGGGSSTGGVQNYQIVKSLDEVKEPKEGTVAFVQTKTENVKFYGWVFDNSNFVSNENFVAHIKYNGTTFVDIYYLKETNGYAWIWNNNSEKWQEAKEQGHTMWYKIDKTAKTFSIAFANLEGYSYEKVEESVVVSDLTVEIPITTQYNIHHRTLDNEWTPDYYYLDEMTQAERKVLYDKIYKLKNKTKDLGTNIELRRFCKLHPIVRNIPLDYYGSFNGAPQEFEIANVNELRVTLTSVNGGDWGYAYSYVCYLNSDGSISDVKNLKVRGTMLSYLDFSAVDGRFLSEGEDGLNAIKRTIIHIYDRQPAQIILTLRLDGEDSTNRPEGMPENFSTTGNLDMMKKDEANGKIYFSAQFIWYDNTIYRGIWTVDDNNTVTKVSLAKV